MISVGRQYQFVIRESGTGPARVEYWRNKEAERIYAHGKHIAAMCEANGGFVRIADDKGKIVFYTQGKRP